LPRLAEGPSAGFPRIYDLALGLISHMDGRVDNDNATQFIAAYQTVTPLMLGELWAFPIMLQLALLENIRRIAIASRVGARSATRPSPGRNACRPRRKRNRKSLSCCWPNSPTPMCR
jgi:Ser/Thr protein kinase RdoA (MazF antagonist)